MHPVEQPLVPLECLVKLVVQSVDVHKRHRHQAARYEEEHNEQDCFDNFSRFKGLEVDDSLAERGMNGV